MKHTLLTLFAFSIAVVAAEIDVYQANGTKQKKAVSGDITISAGGLVAPAAAPNLRTLQAMSLQRTLDPIPNALTGISGVTYNPRTGTLFLVRNVSGSAGFIYEVSLDCELIRTITNSNFIDTEAISYVTSFTSGATIYDVLLVAEEDHTTAANEAQVTLCLMSAAATTLDRSATNGADPDNVTVTTAYSGGTIGNNGLESVCYDPRRGVCYYTAEFRSAVGTPSTSLVSGAGGEQKIYTRSITATTTSLAIGTESVFADITGLMNNSATGTFYNSGTPTSPFDISDMCYDYSNDTLILQSDTGDRAVRLSIASPGTWLEWLVTTAAQPEGCCIHPGGDIFWVVGEDGANAEFFRYGYNSNARYFTNVLTNTAALDFASTAATAVSRLTITVTGAALGDPVILGVPNVSVTATGEFTAWVSAANTVTVQYSPKATEDPASGLFRLTVIKP